MYVNCQGALAIEIWPGDFYFNEPIGSEKSEIGVKQPTAEF